MSVLGVLYYRYWGCGSAGADSGAAATRSVWELAEKVIPVNTTKVWHELHRFQVQYNAILQVHRPAYSSQAASA